MTTPTSLSWFKPFIYMWLHKPSPCSWCCLLSSAEFRPQLSSFKMHRYSLVFAHFRHLFPCALDKNCQCLYSNAFDLSVDLSLFDIVSQLYRALIALFFRCARVLVLSVLSVARRSRPFI